MIMAMQTNMHRNKILLLVIYLLAVSFACTSRALASEANLVAPNIVTISPRLVTSGQPNAASLSRLYEQGFDAVIYLAPPTVADAVAGEA